MMEIAWAPYCLDFRFEARTSRDTLKQKPTYFIRVTKDGATAYGECALFRGLSADDTPDYERHLDRLCAHPEEIASCGMSSVIFGYETAMANLKNHCCAKWHTGSVRIPINGLIWMGDKSTMSKRIDAKLAEGFNVLKLKIGGISFDDELDLLAMIRRRYSPSTLELRLDANGSFAPQDALDRLGTLSAFGIHSIEQPVAAGRHDVMRRLCACSPVPIALDEDIIGCRTQQEMESMLTCIRPHYIILKPALCGGLSGAAQWAATAGKLGIGYWYTSALESNIGLDAIACAAVESGISVPQGLGTGELYHNNIPGPICRIGSQLTYNPETEWKIPQLDWHTTNS